jgi:hypothetical protein
MLNFCTLFNKNYFSRGLALYESLKANTKEFHLYVFAFDDVTFDTLKNLKLPYLTPISLHDFEDEDLLRIKPTRTAGEYCWTCTSSTILYSIKKFNLPHCTYLDADLYFFFDPKFLIEEAKDKSVIITEHRYTPKYDQSSISGTYCVQFMYFKNDSNGMKVLEWWRNECIKWCHAWVEPGRFGDQYYLEDWTSRFEGIHVLQHLGGGLAPWNVQQYKFGLKNNKLSGKQISDGQLFTPVFFHYHRFKFFQNNSVQYTDSAYEISKNVNAYIFSPYLKALKDIQTKMQDASFDIHGTSKEIPESPISTSVVLKWYIKDLFQAFKLILGKGLVHKMRHLHTHSTK